MMAGKTDSRRSMSAYSLAAHAGEKNAADVRMERYHERVGRLRTDRAVWPGAAFIVEALLLLVFLAGSLAVLMSINADAERTGEESADLMNAIVLTSNAAEEFAADPVAFQEAYEADPTADRWLSAPIREVEHGSDILHVGCSFSEEELAAGTMYHVTIGVWKERVLNDVEQAASEGIGLQPGSYGFERWETEPVYTVETQRYVPDGKPRVTAGTTLPVVLGPGSDLSELADATTQDAATDEAAAAEAPVDAAATDEAAASAGEVA